MRLLLSIVVLVQFVNVIRSQEVRTEFSWNVVDFVWPTNIYNGDRFVGGDYNCNNVIILDMAIGPDGTIYVSTKVYGNLPTVSTLKYEPSKECPILNPFPDWSYHAPTFNNCRQIRKVQALLTDEYNRLWVLSKTDRRRCSDRVVVFDLIKKTLLYEKDLPLELSERPPTKEDLDSATIESRNGGLQTTIYIDGGTKLQLISADIVDANGKKDLLVNVYYINSISAPENTPININGGVWALSLSPYTCPHDVILTDQFVQPIRYLYFRPTNNAYVYRIDASVLRENAYVRPIISVTNLTVLWHEVSQQAISQNGVVFYSLYDRNGVDCYHYRNQPSPTFNGHQFLGFTGGYFAALKMFKPNDNANGERLAAFYKIRPQDNNVDNRNYTIVSAAVQDLVRQMSCNVVRY